MCSSDLQMHLPDASVLRLGSRFGVDMAQAERVATVAGQLFEQLLASQTRLDEEARLRHRRKLAWAARLHEVGSMISHSDYHKHGAYILDNTDLLGLSLDESHRLSLLVLGHRGKLRKLDLEQDDPVVMFQLMALRLAVVLCHARRDPDIGGITLSLAANPERQINLACRAAWAKAYPQSAHLLREEVLAWQKTRWTLDVTER